MFIKVFLYLIIFSILHFSYDLTKLKFLIPFGGIDESIFQHLKMAFWAYLITSVIEYSYLRRRFKNFISFFIPRLFSSVIIPWLIFLVWYLAPAIYGKFNSAIPELIWAVLVTILSGISGVLIEREIQGRKFSKAFITVTLLLGIISAFLYIKFTYQLPWIDMFQNPFNL